MKNLAHMDSCGTSSEPPPQEQPHPNPNRPRTSRMLILASMARLEPKNQRSDNCSPTTEGSTPCSTSLALTLDKRASSSTGSAFPLEALVNLAILTWAFSTSARSAAPQTFERHPLHGGSTRPRSQSHSFRVLRPERWQPWEEQPTTVMARHQSGQERFGERSRICIRRHLSSERFQRGSRHW